MEPTSSSCSIQPSIVFLMLTLTVTSAASVMLCVAIMTKHWEYVTWDREKLEALEKNITNDTSGENHYEIEWLLQGQVARVLLEHKNWTKRSVPEQKAIETNANKENNNNNNLPAIFFVPIHGGIWTFCINITAEQQKSLQYMGFPQVLCRNYLKIDTTKAGNLKTDWQHRMQNLSISCALVCLIILGSSALIGAFGVTKRQISAVLVTGVMYLLAAVFAIFSLSIIHFKRAKSKSECLNGSSTYGYAIEGVAISSAALEKPYSLSKISKYFEGRIFTTGWSLHLGWGGAGMCILVSVLWILLSKIMRFNPLNSLLAVM